MKHPGPWQELRTTVNLIKLSFLGKQRSPALPHVGPRLLRTLGQRDGQEHEGQGYPVRYPGIRIRVAAITDGFVSIEVSYCVLFCRT